MAEQPEPVEEPVRRRLPIAAQETSQQSLEDRGDDGSIAFRDPQPPDGEARELRNQIAQALLRVPEVPLSLPKFHLTLKDLSVDRSGLELLFGSPDPVARIRLEMPKGAERASTSVHLMAGARDHIRAGVEVMAERLGVAVTRARWDSVRDAMRALLRLPVGVPLGFFRQRVAGVRSTGLVRTGFDCNQDCGMCWQGRHWGRFGPDAVLRWIEDLANADVREVIVSGGEPMLDKHLTDYIRLARSKGMAVVLETNAMLAARAGYAQTLVDAGLESAFVSLHSGDAEVSDKITRAPGTHALTVKGIHALLDAGVGVTLNAVMTAEGLDALAGLPDFIHSEFGAHPRLRAVMISYPTLPFDPSLLPTIVPDPVRLRAALRVVIDRAIALGVPLEGLGGPCGAPLCLFDADPRVCSREPIAAPVPFRHYAPPCERCAVRGSCFGIRAADQSLFGLDWLRPLNPGD